MKFVYLFVSVILAISLFAATCHAKPCPCDGGACPVPAFRTLTIEVPAVAVVAPEAKAVAADGRRLAGKAIAAPVRAVQAVREREHKPIVRAVQAVAERERRPVARVTRFVSRRR